jgi:hypothetical protein
VNKRLIAGTTAGLAIALSAVGCGGGDDGATASISKAEFVKQANGICAKTQQQLESEFAAYVQSQAGREPQGEDAVAARVDVAKTILIPAKQQEVEEFRALGAPAGDKGQADAIIEAMEEGVQKSQQAPAATVIDSTKAFGRSEALADEYGLSQC